MLLSLHPLWNASVQNEGGVWQFLSIIAKNLLPQQCLLSDDEKKVGLIMSTRVCSFPENLVKNGPVLSEIIGLR